MNSYDRRNILTQGISIERTNMEISIKINKTGIELDTPISDKLLSYQEVLQLTTNNKRALLLGNGFSMAYNKERFSFTSLLKSALEKRIIMPNGPIHKAFQTFKTFDFESIIKALEDTNKVLSAYNYEKVAQFNEDAKKLQQYLVKIITNNHPEKSTDIKPSEYRACMNFVKNYNKVYTLNYDILLYWVIMKLKEEGNPEYSNLISDGFCDTNSQEDYVIFKNTGDNRFGIYHLHGGLHLFNRGADVAKLTFSKTSTPLTEQIIRHMNDNEYPVFISEGTSEAKEAKITHNPYLNHCYKSLAKLSCNLVIFGTGLKKNDEHIQKAIIGSECPNIFIGVSNIDKISEWASFEHDFKSKKALVGQGRGKKKLEQERNVYYYDYRTVDVWGHKADGK